MTAELFTRLPSILVALVAVVASAALGVGGLLVVHRLVSEEFRERHNDVVGFVIAVVGVIYAVLLAFITVIVWEQHNEAADFAQREAAALLDVHRDVEALPEASRRDIQSRLRAYARIVIVEEWPAMARAKSSARAGEALDETWRALLAADPKTPREQVAYGEAFRRLNAVGEGREMRVQASRERLPHLLWAVLLSGAVITVAFCWLFGLPSLHIHALMVSAVAGLIGLVLLLVVALDNPFLGDTRVEPDALELALTQVGPER
jgi:hypothetical protein